MALTAYWIAHATSTWPGTPTGAQIAAGNLSSGSAASYSGSETGFATSGTIQIDETTAISGLAAGTSYTVAWVVHDGTTYSNVTTGAVTTAGSHAATGALSADAATVAGVAADVATYTSTGALSAQSASASGTATHLTLHTSTGALAADAATVAGTAGHTTPGSFSSSGALTADVATVAGTATHLTLHAATGALSADAATVAGTAAHPGSGTGATAAEIVTALMAHEIEPGVSVQLALRVILAAVSGPTAGLGTTTERYYDPDGLVARITATFDGDSNRTSVTLDGS